mmetsp:Transcript_2690/g.5664  ORF Transcript_2690/g.5664 Transcript_2690/m.5664 type:complete len:377 (-) Transcript_2690:61-1191(-)
MAELGVAGVLGAGYVQQGFLTPPTIKALSRATFSILLPMFLCTSIITSVNKYGLSRSQLAVPILAIIQSLVLYTVTTQITLPLFGIDDQSDDGRGATVCCSFGNSGVIPLIFCESLFRRSTAADNVAKSTAFVSLFLVGWSPFFWSFGREVLLSNANSGCSVDDNTAGLLATVKRAFPPPVIGVFIGLFIATTPLCSLFTTTSADTAEKAPLAVIFDSVSNFGRAASPLSLLILVASLAVGAGVGTCSKQKMQSSIQQSKEVHVETRNNPNISFLTKWSFVSLTRVFLSPALMYGLLNLSARTGIIGDADADPMLWFVLILEASMPPAQNSVTMYQVADKGEEAGEMAKFLFAVYATCMLPIVLVLTWALEKFGLA